MSTYSKAKFTQGPWAIEYDNCDAGTCQWYSVGPAKVEVSYNLTALQDDEWKANARLIAAAPELLEALQECVELLEFLSPEVRGGYSPDGAYAKANSAIAKALGGAA
jgi:hypothetical protein